MYVKRHAVVKGGRRYVYLRLVEAYRDAEGRVRHRVLRTLGREDELKASGQLEQLAASFARLDPPPVGTRRHVGPLLLVAHYLDRLGLVELIDNAVPMRGKAMLTHGEVIAALVANRLCAPAPLYDVAGWASSAAMAELFGVPAGLLNDDRLGRALQALAPVAEQIRGELALAAATRCGADLSRLHLDMTAVRFTGGYDGSALVEKGWAADRSIARQVKTLQASTRTGVRGLLPAPPGRGQRGTVYGRCAGAPARAGPTRGHLCRRRRVRLPAPAVRRRCRRAAVCGAAARRHRLGPLVYRRPTRRPEGPAHPGALPPTPPPPTPPTSAPPGKACYVTATSMTPTPAPPIGCASPTSGPPRRPAPSPRPATAPWPAPKPRSPASATAAAGATTRRKSRSTTGSPTSSGPTSPS